MIDDTTYKLCESLNASLKSIKEAEKFLEYETTDAKIKLLEKVTKILNLICKNELIDINNELSEAVLLAWDTAFVTKYDELKALIDTLQWATVDVTPERSLLTEEDKNYDISGVEGELHKNENYKEAVKILESSVKRLDNKIKEVQNNLWNRLIGRVAYIVIGSLALWSVTILNYSKINSLFWLTIILILEPVGVYILILSFVSGFILLSKLLINIKKSKR